MHCGACVAAEACPETAKVPAPMGTRPWQPPSMGMACAPGQPVMKFVQLLSLYALKYVMPPTCVAMLEGLLVEHEVRGSQAQHSPDVVHQSAQEEPPHWGTPFVPVQTFILREGG